MRSVDDFFQYDCIGAPIHPVWDAGFLQRGLELENKEHGYEGLDGLGPTCRAQGPEDQSFYRRSIHPCFHILTRTRYS